MMFAKKMALLSLLALSSSLHAASGTVEFSEKITLSSIVNTVYENHPNHHNEQAQQNVIAANNKLAQALFADNSVVSVSHQNDVIGSSDGLQEWEGSIDMPLWLSGQQQQYTNLSEKLTAQLPAYKQHIRLLASKQVRELIWHVMSANTSVQQRYQAWQAALKLESDISVRVSAGDMATTELLLVNAHVLDMHNQYLDAQSQLQHSLHSYQATTGQQVLPQQYEEIQTGITEINGQHPSLSMLDQTIATLRAQQQLAHYDGATNPNLSVGVRHERDEHGDSFNTSVGVGLSFALSDDTYRQPAIAQASKQLADAEITRQQLARELNTELQNHLHDLTSMQQQRDLLSQQLDTTQKYLALQKQAFDLGEINLESLLRSQALADKTHNKKQSLELNIQHIIALLNQTAGVLL